MMDAPANLRRATTAASCPTWLPLYIAEPYSVEKSLVSTGQFRCKLLDGGCDILIISLTPIIIPRNGPSSALSLGIVWSTHTQALT